MASTTQQVLVPDIGNFKDVNVVEVLVKAGDTIHAEDSLITLETDKATLEVPSPYGGVVKELKVKAGDKVSQGSLILLIESSVEAEAKTLTPPTPPLSGGERAATPVVPAVALAAQSLNPSQLPLVSGGVGAASSPDKGRAGEGFPSEERKITTVAHASPAIRRFARELGVDLAQIEGSGQKGRVTKEDVQDFVKAALAQPRGAPSGGLQVPAMPQVDFAQFGPIVARPLSRIQKISGANLHRNWVSIPHVTQFDEADITEMEGFRKQLNEEYAKQKIKITPLAFLLKASVAALQNYPDFNASLDPGGENLILKRYFHIGVAVDTPEGLVVPVVRDVDKKGIVELAKELGEISGKARDKKLQAAEMQGGSFTISSLGGIGGTAFTPIINAPEVAILGVSRATIRATYRQGAFEPRLVLPLSLSYDHRVIDGASAVRFTVFLTQVLADIRRLVL